MCERKEKKWSEKHLHATASNYTLTTNTTDQRRFMRDLMNGTRQQHMKRANKTTVARKEGKRREIINKQTTSRHRIHCYFICYTDSDIRETQNKKRRKLKRRRNMWMKCAVRLMLLFSLFSLSTCVCLLPMKIAFEMRARSLCAIISGYCIWWRVTRCEDNKFEK